MARILVVDDNSTNRKLVVSLLSFEGHEVIEAVDGRDGLTAARAQRPQLVISDILMPSMDGYEFARQLRADPELRQTAVIFYTAHYHEREAHRLAEACRVARVITKPSSTATLLDAIYDALAGTPGPAPRPAADGFDREHLRLLTDKLAQKAADLSASNARFAALAELNVQFASERDPRVLLERVCYGSRHLLGAKYAVLAVSEGGRGDALIYSTSGLELASDPPARPRIDSGLLASVVNERRSRRTSSENGTPIDVGLPASYPPASAFLIAPLMSLAQTFGWICLADKVGADTFDSEDEYILSFVGAQVGRIYENGSLYKEVQQYAAQLLVEIEERKQAAAKIEHLNRVHALLSGINSLIVRVGGREELFNEACRLATEHGRFRIAWCGWLDPAGSEVVPVATSGDSTEFIGRIRLDVALDEESLVPAAIRLREPTVCNDLQSRSCRVLFRKEMLRRGYRSMVALPLVMEARPVGCLVLVSDEPGFFDEKEMKLLRELAGDISFALDHIAKAEQLNYLAYYDSLTGLANRTFFQERIAQCVSSAARSEKTFALVIADPERFGSINNTFGRHAGDELLRKMAERLLSCVGSSSELGRIGADQFSIIILDVLDVEDVVRKLEEWWRSWLGTPFEVAGDQMRITAKAGIALFPNDGADAETLMKNAEAALIDGKATGQRQYMFFTRSLSERVAESLAIENQLQRALEREEFVLHYQPKVDLTTGRLKGVEALIRWQSPERGLVGPAKFIPLMEETGMIVEVGAWVLRQASLDRSRWLERHLSAPRVAVNVSTVQLRREDFVRVVSNVVRLAGSEAGLDIEVTESLFMDDASGNIGKLAARWILRWVTSFFVNRT